MIMGKHIEKSLHFMPEKAVKTQKNLDKSRKKGYMYI